MSLNGLKLAGLDTIWSHFDARPENQGPKGNFMQNVSRFRSGFVAACLTALMVLLPAVVTSSPADAASKKAAATNVNHVIKPLLPSPEKDAAMVIDGATGKVLYSRNPDAIRYPASLSK